MKKIILLLLIIIPIALFSKNPIDYSITYKLEYKDAKETLLQLVLIDSLTKDTLTAPIEIAYKNQQDSSSKGKMITYDFEKINAPQPFIPALYTFKNNGCRVKDVDIKKNKLNCLTIFLSRGSIEFSYSISDTTPVDFEAKIMFQKYDPQHAIIQDCKKIGHYKLGTYYVEVNTFPISKKHVNVELCKRYTLIIEKPGNLLIDKPSTISALKMYENKFRAWRENKEINLNEKENYTLKIQPGEYKFTWTVNNKDKEKVIKIESDKTESIYFNN
jgi:hypothetical protein